MPAAGFKTTFKSFDRRIRRGMTANLNDAAEFLVDRIRANITTQGSRGDHSAPGDMPYRQEGDLIKSYDSWNVGEMRTRFGSDLEYARFLEQGTSKMAPRPHIEATLLDEIGHPDLPDRMCKPI